VAVVPQPLFGNSLLAAAGHVQRQPLQQRFRQLGARPAIGAAVVRHADLQRGHEDHDPRRGCQTTSLFALKQDLRQESPQRDGWRIDDFLLLILGLAKVDAFFVARPLDVFFGQHMGERQAGDLQKRTQDAAKTVWRPGSRCGKRHETLLGLSSCTPAKEGPVGRKCYTKEGFRARLTSTMGCRKARTASLTKLSGRVRDRVARPMLVLSSRCQRGTAALPLATGLLWPPCLHFPQPRIAAPSRRPCPLMRISSISMRRPASEGTIVPADSEPADQNPRRANGFQVRSLGESAGSMGRSSGSQWHRETGSLFGRNRHCEHVSITVTQDRQNNNCRIWFGGTQRERGRESFSGHDKPHGRRFARKRLPTPSAKRDSNSFAGPKRP
jgi:hypothetical protein